MKKVISPSWTIASALAVLLLIPAVTLAGSTRADAACSARLLKPAAEIDSRRLHLAPLYIVSTSEDVPPPGDPNDAPPGDPEGAPPPGDPEDAPPPGDPEDAPPGDPEDAPPGDPEDAPPPGDPEDAPPGDPEDAPLP